jgi:REP element-mobilizing transposase RayT
MFKFNQPGDIHFFSFRTHNNKGYFKDENCCQLFLANLDFYREKWALKIYGYCLIPNHVHLLIYFDLDKYPDLTISKVVHGIKGRSAQLISKYLLTKQGSRSFLRQAQDRFMLRQEKFSNKA